MKADWNTQVLQLLWQEGHGCRDRWAEQRDETGGGRGGRGGGTEQALRPWKMRKAVKRGIDEINGYDIAPWTERRGASGRRSSANARVEASSARLLQFASDSE